MKSYTDLEQSRKLAEILPLESADMWWLYVTSQGKHIAMMYEEPDPHYIARMESYGIKDAAIRCWSLAVLLSVLPFHLIVNNQRYAFSMHKGLNKDGETYMLEYNVFNTDVCLCSTEYYNNPVDACYEMILKLKELNLK